MRRAVIILVVLFSFLTALIAQNESQQQPQPKVPDTPGQQSTPPITPPKKPESTPPTPAASELKPLRGMDPALMDKTADPCVDFYQYSCGGWVKQNPVPADRAFYGRDAELEERNQVILRDILERAGAANTNRSAVEQKIGDYYSSCMNEPRIEKMGAAALEPELDRIEGLKS